MPKNNPRVAYLLSQYPAISHTFFMREIISLRELGFQIVTASINDVSAPEDGFTEAEIRELNQTYYLKKGFKPLLLLKILGIAVAHPRVFMRGLLYALALDCLNVKGFFFSLFYFAEALLLGNWMRKERCTHLHVHFAGPAATVAMLTSKAWKIDYSMTVHGPDDFYQIDSYYLHKKIVGAKFVLCISNFCRSQLLRLVPGSMAHKFHVSPLGVDENDFSPKYEPEGDCFRIVAVGRLHPSKGFGTLIEAVHQLQGEGRQLKVDIVGGGVSRNELQGMIDQHQLGSIITLHGARNNISTRLMLNKADLFVLPSFAEGVPVALMEAMAKRIACISTYVGGISELIETDKTGILVPASSVEDLKAAIADLMSDDQKRARLAEAGRVKVLTSYNLALNAKRMAKIFSAYKLIGDKDE